MMNNESTNSSTHNSTSFLAQFVEPEGLKIFRLNIFALIILASLLGNAVVLKAVFDSSRRKSVTHYLVANLAAAEMIASLMNVLLQVYAELTYFPFGEVFCHIINPLQTLATVAITNTLAAIALHRYRVFSTQQARKKLTPRQTIILVSVLWIIALAIVFPSFVIRRLVPSANIPGESWCVELFPGDTIEGFPSPTLKRFYMARFILNYVVPIFLMCGSYAFVSSKLRHHRNRSIRDVESTRESSDPAGNDMSTQQQNTTTLQQQQQQQQQQHQQNGDGSVNMVQRMEAQEATRPRPSHRVRDRLKRNRKDFVELERDLLKMFYLIILVFLVFYFPYQVYFLLEYFKKIHWTTWKYFDVTRTYVLLLTSLPSALHPVCYGTMSKFFARTFSRLVLCKDVNT